ncbi:NAD(P)H-binding protein [Asanoa iriomotensis]
MLVTGGTGVLGRELVPRLQARTEVRVLSRRPPPGPGFVQGDLETGEGLAAAVEDVDAIAHCASAADYRRPQRDVTQLRQLLEAIGGARPHLVYVSIVGVDRVRFGFFQAKLDTERLVEDSGLPWTILRATEFHDLMLTFLMRLAKGPAAVVPQKAQFQPVDAGDVAERMAELVMGPAAGRVRELGGPKVESMADLMRAYLAAARRRRRVIEIPVWGRLGAGLGLGGQLLTDDDRGSVSFADYLHAHTDADGVLDVTNR